jgi:UDP-N-acetylmuramyl tripeptide synthase
VHLLLVKNPVGGNEVLRLLAAEAAARGEPLHLLAMLNDNAADGHDVSWIWDVDAEVLAGHVARVVFGGTRAEDLALRFKYGDVVDAGARRVPWGIEREAKPALDAALAGCPPGATLYAVVTYTAMLALRAELAARGHLRPYWEAR